MYSIIYQLALNLGHNPLYRHFRKCLYAELLKTTCLLILHTFYTHM